MNRVKAALKALGDPQTAFQSIVVGGTNGKGTVSYNIARAWGKTCGLFSSPHLIDVRERITQNAEWFDDGSWQHAYEDIQFHYKGKLSYFEWLFLLAVVMFKRAGLRRAVFEVGMGGRLDAANALEPVLSVITSVSLDHTEFLGTDRPTIAMEKIAIARPNRPVVLPEDVFELGGVSSFLKGIGSDVHTLKRPPGKNANTQLVEKVTNLLKIKQKAFRYPSGRRQFWNPNLVLDTAHNREALEDLCEWLSHKGFKNYNILFSLTGNRRPEDVVEVFRGIAKSFWTLDLPSENGVALEVYRLAGVRIIDRLEDLFHEPLLICGSHALVGYALRTLNRC